MTVYSELWNADVTFEQYNLRGDTSFRQHINTVDLQTFTFFGQLRDKGFFFLKEKSMVNQIGSINICDIFVSQKVITVRTVFILLVDG